LLTERAELATSEANSVVGDLALVPLSEPIIASLERCAFTVY
jgi:hypothetical protein